jgi:hypothetical protein
MMSKHRNYKFALFTGIVLAFAGVILAQSETAPPPVLGPAKVLIVNGTSAGDVTREIDGITYVDVEALAHAVRGSVTIESKRVLLTIPPPRAATGEVAIPNVDTSLPVTRGLSTDFKRAAISELSNMREWRGAVGAMITYGLAASDQTAKDYHDQCEDGMNQAAVAVETDADRSAVRLLKNQFDNMTAWANQILAERKQLNGARTVNPNALQNDRQLASITACGRFLNSMIVSGAYADDTSCH